MVVNVAGATIMNNIIIYRSERGIGDACMLLPAVEQLERTHPTSEIVIVMGRPQSAVFDHKGYTIIPVEQFDIADYGNAMFFNVSSCCLQYELQRDVKKSRFEIFADQCSVEVEKKGSIVITPEEKRFIYDRAPVLSAKSQGYKLIGIVIKAAQEFRTYPHIKLLIEYFNRSVIFDKQAKKIIPIAIDLEDNNFQIYSTVDFDIRETIVFISQLDLVIGPDTGPMHVAGSLGVPTLWLFGPTDPRMRTLFYPEAHVIWKPCQKTKACWYDHCEKLNCLWKISPWSVARYAKKILCQSS